MLSVPLHTLMTFINRPISRSLAPSFLTLPTSINNLLAPLIYQYLNIQRYRFYIKCVVCSRGITFLTDPENGDYEMESGASRNYEVWKDKSAHEEGEAEEDEKKDAIGQLEDRVEASRREQAEQDRLEEIIGLNARHAGMGGDVDRVFEGDDEATRRREEEVSGGRVSKRPSWGNLF